MADPSGMNCESPIARRAQATVEIETWLERHLTDVAGALHMVLLRRVKESELFLKNFERPLDVLAVYCRALINSEYGLKELVRESGAECGRILHEGPYFDRAGSPPHPDDCYTFQSVRGASRTGAGALGSPGPRLGDEAAIR